MFHANSISTLNCCETVMKFVEVARLSAEEMLRNTVFEMPLRNSGTELVNPVVLFA